MKMCIVFRDPVAQRYYEALAPEIASVPYKKTRSRLSIEKYQLVIQVEGDDINAIRGTFNAYLNWLRIIEDSFALQ